MPQQRANSNDDLSAWLDGELSESEAARIEQQLQRDPELRAEVDELRSVIELLRTHGPRRAPPDFEARVMEALVDEPIPSTWWRHLRRPFGIQVEGLALAAAVLLVVGIGVRSQLGSSAAPEATDAKAPAAMAMPQAKEEPPKPVATAEAPRVEQAQAKSESGKTKGEDYPIRTTGGYTPVSTAPPAPNTYGSSAKMSSGTSDATLGTPSTADPELVHSVDMSTSGLTSTSTAKPTAPATAAPDFQTRVSVSARDGNAVAEVLKIVGRYGARMTTLNGSGVDGETPAEAGPFRVVIPDTKLTAFYADLGKVGVTSPFDDAGKMHPTEVTVILTLKVPGASSR